MKSFILVRPPPLRLLRLTLAFLAALLIPVLVCVAPARAVDVPWFRVFTPTYSLTGLGTLEGGLLTLTALPLTT